MQSRRRRTAAFTPLHRAMFQTRAGETDPIPSGNRSGVNDALLRGSAIDSPFSEWLARVNSLASHVDALRLANAQAQVDGAPVAIWRSGRSGWTDAVLA